MISISLIIDNIRSAENIGSIFRLADGLGVRHIYICGISPYPKIAYDRRLKHIIDNVSRKIHKSALGAEKSVSFSYHEDILKLVDKLHQENYSLIAIEQDHRSVSLLGCNMPRKKICLILGNEVEGVNKNLLELVDQIVEIPMSGTKESFNVASAAAMALFWLKYKS